LLSASFFIMLIVSVISLIVLCACILYLESEVEVRIYILIISLGGVFQAFMVIDYNFQAQIKAKYSSIAKSVALVFSSVSKIVLVLNSADLYYFALFYALDYLVVAILLLVLHVYKKQVNFLQKFNVNYVLPLLRSAWPMVLSALSVVIYMRIDQIMIKNILGSYELGLYAAAVKVYEGWLVLPYVFGISLLPA